MEESDGHIYWKCQSCSLVTTCGWPMVATSTDGIWGSRDQEPGSREQPITAVTSVNRRMALDRKWHHRKRMNAIQTWRGGNEFRSWCFFFRPPLFIFVFCTTLYRKPTARKTILHAQSTHPMFLIHSIPYMQYRTLRKNGSSDDDFNRTKEQSLLVFYQPEHVMSWHPHHGTSHNPGYAAGWPHDEGI